MKCIYSVICVALLVGCADAKKPIHSYRTSNPDIIVGLLFEHDGARVYRFVDAGEFVYYAVSADPNKRVRIENHLAYEPSDQSTNP